MVELSGAAADSTLLQSIAVGGTTLVFTIASLFLINRFGRRPLLFFGSIAAAALFLVAWQFESAYPNGR